MLKFLKALLVMALLVLCQSSYAAEPRHKGTLLFVPMDNRPVCLDYTVQTMQAAGWDVKTPPREYIAGADTYGEPEKLLDWVEQNARESVAVVASTDALIYGGLVSSRVHELPMATLKQRAERIVNLKKKVGGGSYYLFTTIMRSPKASSAPVEPAYYKEYGPKIFRIGALEDKKQLKAIKSKEEKELQDLYNQVPEEVMLDLYARRANNIKTTELLLHGVESGDFDYLLIGRDDTAPFSQAHKEARALDVLVHELPMERIRFFAGADQLGQLLLTRAARRLQFELPLVNVTYAPGVAGKTVPTYEDDTVARSAYQHIYAAGAFPVKKRDNADLVLAINTPKNGVTIEAGNPANTSKLTPEVKAFVGKVARLVAHDHKVSVADIKYGNGADNALVPELFAQDIGYRLAAYSGWNTAGNSLGFALAQGLLVNDFTPADKKQLLDARYLDDWAYQANVRMQVYQSLIWPNYWPNSGLNEEQTTKAEAAITAGIKQVSDPVMGGAADLYKFTLPWERMFEVKVEPKA